MFFLNLTAAEFFTLLGVLGSFVAALYLLDRAKRTRVVSTLRFWTSTVASYQRQNRRRMQDTGSLVLQLLCLTLLLLAIAQLAVGPRQYSARNHVLLLDTSAWTAQRSGGITLLDRERQAAVRYIAALPPLDRVMVVRTDALATPATAFTADRKQIMLALATSTPGFSALNLPLALAFARQAQNWARGEPGEAIYIGPGMLEENQGSIPEVKNLRTILLRPEREHIGIRGLSVAISETDQHTWRAAVIVKNYGQRRATVRLEAQCAGTPFAPRNLSLNGGGETTAEYEFVTHRAGQLVTEIKPMDSLTTDQRLSLELPQPSMLRVAVVTKRPELLSPLFAANERLNVRIFSSFEREAETWADLIVFDQIPAPTITRKASIWIDPPANASPLPVQAIVPSATIARWNPDTPLSAGLHTKDTQVHDAEIFQTFEGDVIVASSAEGPMIVARDADSTHGKLTVLGFDPFASELRFQVTTPLLFGNLLRWVSPGIFRPVEAMTQRVGALSIALDKEERPDAILVLDDHGQSVPFLARNRSLEIFARRPETLRVLSGQRERELSIVAPDVAATEWNPPANGQNGPPDIPAVHANALELWKWLALVAALGLIAEWTLFGSRRVHVGRPMPANASAPLDRETELVAK